MQPVLILGDSVNITQYVKWDDGIKTTSNDLDADGSGRNILDGLMYRTLIATKHTLSINLLRIPQSVMSQILTALSGEYVTATALDPKAGRHVTRTYYNSTVNQGVPRYLDGDIYYDGVSFDLIER